MKKLLIEGAEIPKGYGIAYREINSLIAVVYPIPINIIVGSIRRFYFWLTVGHKLYEDGYFKGYQEGINKGTEYAFHQYKTQALQGEIGEIVRNFLVAEKETLFKERSKQIGWILKFIDKETKRIKDHS